MINKNAKIVLDVLQRYPNSWVDAKLIQEPLPLGESFGALIADLKKAGYAIVNQLSPDPKRKSWQYKLIVVDKKTIRGGWICSRCGRMEPIDSVESNTLSDRHARTYCVSCKKKQVFELRR